MLLTDYREKNYSTAQCKNRGRISGPMGPKCRTSCFYILRELRLKRILKVIVKYFESGRTARMAVIKRVSS